MVSRSPTNDNKAPVMLIRKIGSPQRSIAGDGNPRKSVTGKTASDASLFKGLRLVSDTGRGPQPATWVR